MSRTVLNVSGDLTAACVVARSEGEWSAADVEAGDEEVFAEEPLDEAPAVYEPPRL
jgi:Na+/H+-dicarboxylate symporter